MGIAPKAARAVTVRLVEWRARRRDDPVARLQFLQDKMTSGPSRRGKQKMSLGRLPAPAITLGLALAGAALLRPWAAPRISPPIIKSHVAATTRLPVAPETSAPRVWLVEASGRSDLYSNGLRVENQFLTSSAPRKYLAFARARLDSALGERRTAPAGIVFHTTESHMAPFEEDQTQALRRAGEGLLEYVSRRSAYHFVIDRFGRVFRIVRESDYANHAGNSIWADDKWAYVNLNESFFGVAFEAQSHADGEQAPVNAAQIHAARILTEMLRARYGFPATNCVTHAQVSVNPGNRLIGYHRDWAANLPFHDLGLSDNYQRPPASITLFGFEAEPSLIEAGGAPLEQGLESAEEEIRQQAAARKLPVADYRRALQKRYRQVLAAQRAGGSAVENQ